MSEQQLVAVHSTEYKTRFLKYMHDVYRLDEDMATCELAAQLDGFDDGETSIPEWDADECISYWGRNMDIELHKSCAISACVNTYNNIDSDIAYRFLSEEALECWKVGEAYMKESRAESKERLKDFKL